MVIQLDAENNTIRLLNGDGNGIIISSAGITLTAGDSGLTLGSDGTIKMVGTGQVQVDGSTVVLGSVVVPGVNSALVGVTGVSGRSSLKCMIE